MASHIRAFIRHSDVFIRARTRITEIVHADGHGALGSPLTLRPHGVQYEGTAAARDHPRGVGARSLVRPAVERLEDLYTAST